ncbi:unnamed protein product [Toxocara canis]|uniref:Secreted protein n=1 Tax=Toxocara canis TaxID=6265 RepID=A0A183UE81_TOXCA|nr:unnamed protein product [Toxocara canis]
MGWSAPNAVQWLSFLGFVIAVVSASDVAAAAATAAAATATTATAAATAATSPSVILESCLAHSVTRFFTNRSPLFAPAKLVHPRKISQSS